MRTICFVLPVVGLALGCNGSPPAAPAAAAAALQRTQSCGELLDRIQEDAIARVEMTAANYPNGHFGWRGGWDEIAVSGDAPASARVPEPAPPDEFSETNTQVEGIDEGDFVENDGEHVYVLNGNELIVLDTWPAEQTHILTRTEIEGYPSEMFVANGRALVFSHVTDPRETADQCDNHYRDYGYYYPCWSGDSFTKLTLIDLQSGAPEVLREVYVEGYYHSSRRDDDKVRALIHNWGYYYSWQLPQIWEFVYPPGPGETEGPTAEEQLERVEAWRLASIAAIRARPLEDWLPVSLERRGGVLTTVAPDCNDFYMTQPGLTDYGITQIAGLSMADGDTFHRTSIWGTAHQLYANADTMVLAQEDYSQWYHEYLAGAETFSSRSAIHRFNLSTDGDAHYVGSGFVPGSIADQFSIDERDGVIWLATTQTTSRIWRPGDTSEWTPPESINQVVSVVTADGGAQEVVGRTEGLAPGERIFSTRFIGDIAYVVTFRQVDPLFAIDISDMSAPHVLGELKIPGFSDYIHPLGEGHLLTIGRDADEEGLVRGLALQIFDVTDPVHPMLAHRELFQDTWGYSDANWDHHAFTYFASRGLLAFPYYAWNDTSSWSFRSSLEIFSVDAERGFSAVGSVDHSSLLVSECGYDNYYCREYGLTIRRGVFIEDYVYSISHGGVLVHLATDMSQVASVSF